MKRTLMLLAVAAAGILASVTAARAGVVTNTTTSIAYAGWVPCANAGAGELVTGTIEVHDLVTSTTNGNVEAWQFQSEPRGTLVGSVTGDAYRLAGITRGTYVEGSRSGEYAATYVSRYLLIGPGPGNDLVVRETAHLTLDGDEPVVEHDEWTIACS